MKKFLVILFFVFICGTAYADKNLYMTWDSKPLKLSDNDFEILCDNSVCYFKYTSGTEEDKKETVKRVGEFLRAAFWFEDNINGKKHLSQVKMN